MISRSKKTGRIFTGKLASLMMRIGLASPVEEKEVKPQIKKKPGRPPVKKK